MKFQRHTLQLLPDRHRGSYAGAAVVVLQGLDGRLSLQHEGRIIAAQEAPPSPGSLRNGINPSSGDAIRSPDPKGLSEPRETAPDLLTMVAAANGHGSVIDDADVVSMTVTTSPRRSTFLQQARWDAVQRAQARGHVHSPDGKRVGSPQRYRKAIHQCRNPADAPVVGNPAGIDI